jgi:hypothetical protein
MNSAPAVTPISVLRSTSVNLASCTASLVDHSTRSPCTVACWFAYTGVTRSWLALLFVVGFIQDSRTELLICIGCCA